MFLQKVTCVVQCKRTKNMEYGIRLISHNRKSRQLLYFGGLADGTGQYSNTSTRIKYTGTIMECTSQICHVAGNNRWSEKLSSIVPSCLIAVIYIPLTNSLTYFNG